MTEARTYKIGEVADMLHLKTHVLRFWQTQFPQIAPLRTQKGQRLYTEEHVALLRRIQHMLHVDGMTIERTRRILSGDVDEGAISRRMSIIVKPEFLDMLSNELAEIRNILSFSEN